MKISKLSSPIIFCVLLGTPSLLVAEEAKDLIQLRDSWSAARKVALEQVDSNYHKALTKLQKRLLKGGDLDGALKVREEIKALGWSATSKKNTAEAAKGNLALIGRVSGSSNWRKLRLGVDSTRNRPGRTWSVIPPALKGWSFSTYRVRGAKAIKVEVNKPGRVRIAVLESSKAPLERGGWTKTGMSLVSTVHGDYHIWEKSFEESFSLPKPHNHHGYIILRE